MSQNPKVTSSKVMESQQSWGVKSHIEQKVTVCQKTHIEPKFIDSQKTQRTKKSQKAKSYIFQSHREPNDTESQKSQKTKITESQG